MYRADVEYLAGQKWKPNPMTIPEKIPKILADALLSSYARALAARDAVEHRLSSLPQQQAVVRRWEEDLVGTAAKEYPGQDINSYPVQTRMMREIAKLKRYESELPERLAHYATALEAVERRIVDIKAAAPHISGKTALVSWPELPSALGRNAWPRGWPSRPTVTHQPGRGYSLNIRCETLPTQPPVHTVFRLSINGETVELQALYEDGIETFELALNGYLSGISSSRWCAITEAVRCGISWPVLDAYLAECDSPWLPTDYVGADFGLRGSLKRRGDLAELFSRLSPEAGRWYLENQPSLYPISQWESISKSIFEELISVGLVSWGPTLPLSRLLPYLPFSEVKALFALSLCPIPRNFADAAARLDEIIERRGEPHVRAFIKEFIDPSDVIVVEEVPGFDREERLGPRARANVMVSTLILLDEENPDARHVLSWKG